jgi:hypothetical protein
MTSPSDLDATPKGISGWRAAPDSLPIDTLSHHSTEHSEHPSHCFTQYRNPDLVCCDLIGVDGHLHPYCQPDDLLHVKIPIRLPLPRHSTPSRFPPYRRWTVVRPGGNRCLHHWRDEAKLPSAANLPEARRQGPASGTLTPVLPSCGRQSWFRLLTAHHPAGHRDGVKTP